MSDRNAFDADALRCRRAFWLMEVERAQADRDIAIGRLRKAQEGADAAVARVAHANRTLLAIEAATRRRCDRDRRRARAPGDAA